LNLNDKWCEYDFELGDFQLDSGEVLQDARLHYHQIGAPDAPTDNLVILPTYYGGRGSGNRAWVDDPNSPINSARYCVIIPCMFGAGESSSPSNTAGPQGGAGFPRITLGDNVRAQHALLEARFPGVKPRLVMGWSMGGMQALQWAASYPQEVGSVLAVCATARCYPHNRLFLEGVASALKADQAFAGGAYKTPPVSGLEAFARVCASWAYSQAFFRDGLYEQLGFASIDALVEYWIDDHLNQDANDLLTQLHTWQHADVLRYREEQAATDTGSVTLSCPGILMPSSTDLYFTEADARIDAEILGAQLIVLNSDYGHIAGGPGRLPNETNAIFAAVESLLLQSA